MSSNPLTDIELPTFEEPDDFSDITLAVEEKKLHYFKVLLATTSPVWRRMFLGNFQEKEAKEIALPDKKASDVTELLLWIYPAAQKRVNADNVIPLLSLSEEYQINRLKRECELTLTQQIGKSSSPRKIVEYLTYAVKYNLKSLEEKSLTLAGRITQATMTGLEIYNQLDADTQEKVTVKRIEHLEAANKSLADNLEKMQNDIKEMSDKHKTEKQNIRRYLNQIYKSWGEKNARGITCDSHSQPPHIKCLECNEAARQYIVGCCDTLFDTEASGVDWPDHTEH